MVRRLRLWSGLVIAAFVLGHLTNLSLGLLSVAAMDAMRVPFSELWQSPPMTVLLYGSLILHLMLGLWGLFRRSHLRMSGAEAAQLLLGLGIPLLLLGHAIPSRLMNELLGIDVTYAFLVSLFAYDNGWVRQVVLVLLVWSHFVVFLYFWLRLKRWYPRAAPALHALAVLVPVLALLGFGRAAMEMRRKAAADPAWRDTVLSVADGLTPTQYAWTFGVADALVIGFVAAVGLVMLGRAARHVWRNRHGRFRVEHPSRRQIAAPIGTTLLDAIKGSGLGHASVCGGRGRCTTCRVRVGRGLDDLPPPGEQELKALRRIDAPPPIRLACQVRPRRNLSITPLLNPTASDDNARRPGGVSGREQRVACLFCDLRGSTALGEQRLPYDVVFILNRFFAAMAEALVDTNGHYAQFTGDGLMALYGLEGPLDTACQDAVAGAVRMLERLEAINRSLTDELPEPLRMGIGIHAGDAIVGTMGPPASPIISAVGDTINIAARLESKTKEFGVPLVLSVEAAEITGHDFSGFARDSVPVRGRRGSVDAIAVSAPHRIGGVRRFAPLVAETAASAAAAAT